MVQGSSGFVVVLGALPGAGLPGEVAYHCATMSEAEVVLDAGAPEAVVIDAGVSWQRAIAQRARDRGAAVMAVGPRPPAGMLVDEWVGDGAADQELAVRLRLARARARERRRWLQRSCTDLLTGLPNRRAVLRAGIQFAARAQRTGDELALVLVDLDGFKEINDRLGHPAGDRVLRKVGAVLMREVRQDEVAGRIGGDEFAVVLKGGELAARRTRDRVLSALREEGISATAGLAVSTVPGRARHLYADADAALLAAKRQCRRDVRSPRFSSHSKEVESNNHLSLA